jgi:hypothetical protein
MIGSLKSMSFLGKHKTWKNPFSWFNKKVQIVNIKEQYEKYNVRAFDMHLTFVGKSKKAVFIYDGISYETFSIYEYLNYLNNVGNAYVRIVLEADKDSIDLETRFYEYCSIIESIYQKIKFFGGYRESDSKLIYKFENDAPNDLVFYERVDKLNCALP